MRAKKTESSVEMMGEALDSAGRLSSTAVLDNPLWSLRVDDNTDDPFESDFEEQRGRVSVLGGGF